MRNCESSQITLNKGGFTRELQDTSNSDSALGVVYFEELQSWSAPPVVTRLLVCSDSAELGKGCWRWPS